MDVYIEKLLCAPHKKCLLVRPSEYEPNTFTNGKTIHETVPMGRN